MLAKIRNIDDMNLTLAKKIIGEFVTISGNNVKISSDGLGEPFISSGIFELLYLIRKNIQNTFIHANTNAINLDREITQRIINADIDSLVFSINAWDKDTDKKINGVETSYYLPNSQPTLIANMRNKWL